MQLKAKGIILC